MKNHETHNTIIKDDAINELLKNIPLETEIHVAIEMGLITFIHDNGFREEKMWNDNNEEDNKLLASIGNFSDELTSEIINMITKSKDKELINKK